jgi:hypothetical protein
VLHRKWLPIRCTATAGLSSILHALTSFALSSCRMINDDRAKRKLRGQADGMTCAQIDYCCCLQKQCLTQVETDVTLDYTAVFKCALFTSCGVHLCLHVQLLQIQIYFFKTNS